MNFFKKNQMLIYVIALMLVVAGYLSYTSHDSETIQTGTQNIGDAQLVSTNIVPTENTQKEQTNIVQEENITKVEKTEEDENLVETQETAVKAEKDDYFSKSKLERDTMYSQMLETYEKVLNGINSLETQKQSAAEEIKKINDTKNSIMIAENLITTKGFPNNVIFVNGESISAIIGVEELKQEEISQIQNILSRELKANIENIHIAVK